MKKLLSIFMLLLITLTGGAWCNNAKSETKEFKIEYIVNEDVKTFYLDDLNEFVLEDKTDIQYFNISKLNDGKYETQFEIDLRYTTYDNINYTHAKMFVWGFQVYFDHQTMLNISQDDDLYGAISAVIAAISAAFGPTGVAIGIAIAIFNLDWVIAKKADKGDGVTLSYVTVGGVHWWNSGNCVRSGWF